MQRILKTTLLVTLGLAIGACGPSEAERAKAEAAAEARAAAAALEAKERAEALEKLAAERSAALWLYQSEPVAGKRVPQVTAQITSTGNVDTDGSGGKSVRLIFRDHPDWGRSSYLVLNAGDFNCYGGCSLNVAVDDEAPKKMAGRRPVTDQAIAMFVNDWQSLWKMTAGAKKLTIEFPVKAGGTRTATFDISGLDRSRMPGWDALAKVKAPAAKQP